MSRVWYTADHQWCRLENDGTFTVGITPYARERLGEIVFVELPTIGERIEGGGEAIVLESAKSVVEVPMPLDGVVDAVNDALAADPGLLNADPAGAGWLLRVRRESTAEPPPWLDEAAYLRLVSAELPEEEL